MSRYNSMPYLLQGIKRAQASTNSPSMLGRVGNRIKGIWEHSPERYLYKGVRRGARGVENALRNRLNTRELNRSRSSIENRFREMNRSRSNSAPPSGIPAPPRPQQGRPQQGSQPQGSQPVNRKKFNYNMV